MVKGQNMKLRYSEAFYSIQGEGKFVGVPSVFLRTFGCNFRCMNFGKARGSENPGKMNVEVRQLLDEGVLAAVNKFEDLPIVSTGCDTYASIYPEFKKYMMDRTVDEVVEHLLSLTPEGKWTMSNGQDIHLIFTGGEPLLGWQKFYEELLEHPRMGDLKNVTFETNTTQALRPDFKNYLEHQDRFRVTWSCSPKLSVSGESWDDAIKPDIAGSYSAIPNSDIYFKFVVADEVDVDEVARAVDEYRKTGINCPVYVMPVGGRSEVYKLNIRRVAELAMERGWRYTPRLHVDIFGNAWGT
jgi:organic radical activating enzyme